MRKTIYIIIAAAACACLFGGCRKEFSGDECIVPGSRTGVLHLSISLDGVSVNDWGSGEKSRFSDGIEQRCSGLSFAIYAASPGGEWKGWRLQSQKEYSTLAELNSACEDLSLERRLHYRLFVVMNLHRGGELYRFPEDMALLENAVFTMGEEGNSSFADVQTGGIPASGSTAELSFGESYSIDAQINLTRLFSKIVFSVDRTGYEGETALNPSDYFRDYGITVSHLNANLCLFQKDGFTPSFTDTGDTEYEVCTGLAVSNTYTFYVPANVHPSLVCSGEPSSEVEPTLTKLTFRGNFLEKSGFSGTGTYCCYLGGGDERGGQKDYDLFPGKQYGVSLGFTAERFFDSQGCWQFDRSGISDTRFFGLRWACEATAAQSADNSLIEDAAIVARPGRPARFGLWYSTKGSAGGEESNEYAKFDGGIRPDDGSPLESIADMRFTLDIGDAENGISGSFGPGGLSDALKQYMTMSYDVSTGEFTVCPKEAGIGRSFYCVLNFYPRREVEGAGADFILSLADDVSLTLGDSAVYVAQSIPVEIDNAYASYSIRCSRESSLKCSNSSASPFFGSEPVEVDRNVFGLYAWNSSLKAGGDRRNIGHYEDITLSFIPGSPNDPPFERNVKVYLPDLLKTPSDIVLPVDGESRPCPISYRELTGDCSPMTVCSFDGSLYELLLKPSCTCITRNGDEPFKQFFTLSSDNMELWLNCIPDFSIVDSYLEAFPEGVRDSRVVLQCTPPSIYAGESAVSVKLEYAYPEIGAFSGDGSADGGDILSEYFNSTARTFTISNPLSYFRANGNVVQSFCNQDALAGATATRASMVESGGTFSWQFYDPGEYWEDVNWCPCGLQRAYFSVKNRHDEGGRVWRVERSFKLYHSFDMILCSYFAVVGTGKDSQSTLHTERFNKTEVFPCTGRHWSVMKRTWLNTTDFFGNVPDYASGWVLCTAGIPLYEYIQVQIGHIKDPFASSEYDPNSDSTHPWGPDVFLTGNWEYEGQFIYDGSRPLRYLSASNPGIGQDEVWGYDWNWHQYPDGGTFDGEWVRSTSFRRQYNQGNYFDSSKKSQIVYDINHCNACFWDPEARDGVGDSCGNERFLELLGKVTPQGGDSRSPANYVTVNDGGGNAFAGIQVEWLAEGIAHQ